MPPAALTMASPPRSQRGIALVIVTWIAVLLLIIASSFLFEGRTDLLIVRNSVSMARAEAAADAGVQRAVWEIYRTDNSTEGWKRDGTPRSWSFDGVPVTVEISDESAKIDVNTASDALLRGLFVAAGLNDEEAGRQVEAILDWRDPDSLVRPNGAEDAEYRSAGLAHRPANSPFQAIEELQLVLGMRPEVFRRISPLITVYSRQPGINPHFATRDVLLAIPGITAEIVDAYVARREAARALGQALPPFTEAGAFAVPGSSQIASLRSLARLEDGTVFLREAVALTRPVPRRPVTFLVWRESTAEVPLAESKPEAAEAKN